MSWLLLQEMSRIMGLKMWINWVTWVFFTMMLFIPTSVVITYFLTEGSNPAVAANPIIVWLVLILFMLTFITLIFAISTFFTNGEMPSVHQVFSYAGSSCHGRQVFRAAFGFFTYVHFLYFFHLLTYTNVINEYFVVFLHF